LALFHSLGLALEPVNLQTKIILGLRVQIIVAAKRRARKLGMKRLKISPAPSKGRVKMASLGERGKETEEVSENER